MLDKKVKSLLNTQINKELFSAYLYLGFANYYEDEGLSGFSNWYMVQAQEERDHAMLMLKYLQMNGETIELLAVEKPDQEFTDHMEPLKEALKHEQYVTKLINQALPCRFVVKSSFVIALLILRLHGAVSAYGNCSKRILSIAFCPAGYERTHSYSKLVDLDVKQLGCNEVSELMRNGNQHEHQNC